MKMTSLLGKGSWELVTEYGSTGGSGAVWRNPDATAEQLLADLEFVDEYDPGTVLTFRYMEYQRVGRRIERVEKMKKMYSIST